MKLKALIRPFSVFLFIYIFSLSCALWAEQNESLVQRLYNDGVDEAGCYQGHIFHPPFLVSDVFGPSDVEGFEKQTGTKKKVVNIKVHSDHLISQFVKTDNNPNAILPRGSLVALNFSKELVPQKESSKSWGFDFGSFFPALLDRSSKSKTVPTRHQSFTIRTDGIEPLDVRVITVNDIYNRMQTDTVTDRSVEDGEMAYDVPSSSLIALNENSILWAQEDFTINVKSLPYLDQRAQTINVPADSYFKIVTNKTNEYEAYTCYKTVESQLNVTSYYLFRFFDSSQNFKETRFFANPFEMNFTGKVLPYTGPQVDSLMQVQGKLERIFKNQENLDYILTSFSEINYQGFLRLPTETNAIDKEESLDDQKSYTHYGTEIDPLASDDWGQASTICGIMELSYLWKKHCDQKFRGTGCQLQIGDIAFPVQGFVTSNSGKRAKWKKAKKCRSKRRHHCEATTVSNSAETNVSGHSDSGGKDILGHATHYAGTCVDIRPLRNDNELNPVQIRSRDYDRSKTAEFLKLAKAYGATKRYFNDSKLISLGLSERMPGHDDHVHICFEEKNFCESSSDQQLHQLIFSSKEK